MTSRAGGLHLSPRQLPPIPVLLPALVAAAAFGILFWEPLVTLGRDWWSDPDAGHGLLLAPVAVFLAWKAGLEPAGRGRPVLGLIALVLAVGLRYLSGLAAELFTMRLALLGAIGALVIYARGLPQLRRWWLSAALLVLSIPLPDVLTSTLAFPLQLKASQLGAALLDARHVPVRLAGNVLHLPGRSLFVTEACSGLRSLTALLALGVLIGGLWLRTVWGRAAIVALAIPVAMGLNGLRIFLTGFLVYFVSPSLGEGVMHYTEGWAIFVVAFAILGACAWGLSRLEALRRRPGPREAAA
jgi:exosortase